MAATDSHATATHNAAFLDYDRHDARPQLHAPGDGCGGDVPGYLADSGDEEEGSDCDEGVGDGEQRTRVGDEGGLLVGELESLSAGPKA